MLFGDAPQADYFKIIEVFQEKYPPYREPFRSTEITLYNA